MAHVLRDCPAAKVGHSKVKELHPLGLKNKSGSGSMLQPTKLIWQ